MVFVQDMEYTASVIPYVKGAENTQHFSSSWRVSYTKKPTVLIGVGPHFFFSY